MERRAWPGAIGDRRNHQTGAVSLDPLRWGLIPYWSQDPKGGRKSINAKCETVRTLPMFRDAYRRRRCIVPVDGFFEWKAIKGQRAKQPYAIAMKDGSPFGIGGLWENWRQPSSREWIRTFVIITTDANELVAEIHDRMPLILAPDGYVRAWLAYKREFGLPIERPRQPTVYTERTPEIAKTLVARGFNDFEIAGILGVDPGTISHWKVAHPEFAEALKFRDEDGTMADDRVKHSLTGTPGMRARSPRSRSCG